MSCQIKFNQTTGKTEVKAPNGEDSVLYNTISQLPEIENEMQAVRAWLVAYTKSFKDWYGLDWETVSGKEKARLIEEGYLDRNGEPNLFFRGDFKGRETFNYSEIVGKFGQGIYLAENLKQAESFAATVDKKVYPVFLAPGKSLNFKNVTTFKQAVAKFKNIETVPTEQDVQDYVHAMHNDGYTIIGNGVMGREYNLPNKQLVRSPFTQSVNITNPVYFDNTSVERQFMTQEYQESKKADKFINELISRLSKNTNINAEMVSADDAALITKDAQNPYKGQSAFFYKGKVYFVLGKMNYDTVFHEFAHPVVRAIRQENKELFDSLYQDLIDTTQGIEFLNEAVAEYPELDPTDDQIKEEVIVKALTFIAQEENKLDPQVSGVLRNIINQILYAIRKALRKLTGKSASKLDVNTSLKDLADMIMDDTWNINLENTTEDDIAAYMKDIKDYAEDMSNFHKSEKGRLAIHRAIKDNIRITRDQIREIKNSGHEEDIKIILSDKSGKNDLKEMSRNLAKFTTKAKINEAYNEKIDELREFEKKVESLLFNMDILDKSITRIQEYIKYDLQDEPDQRKALGQVTYYRQNLAAWGGFIERFLKDAENAGIPGNAPIIEDLAALKNRIESGTNSINNIYKAATVDALFEFYEPMNQGIRDDVKRRVDAYRKEQEGLDPSSRAYQLREARIKEAEEDLERIIDKEKFGSYIVGNMGDIGTASAWLENYISSQDPSISSFAAYIKKHMSDVQVDAHRGYNKFATEIEPLLKDLGVKPSQLNKFAELFLFEDTSYKRNEETKELESYTVHTFLNEHKDYKLSKAALEEKVNQAETMYELERNDKTRQDFINAIAELDNHMKLFFHQEFVDEFYHADDILDNSEIGREAKRRKDDILYEIQSLEAQHSSEHGLHDDYETIEELWREYRQLFSIYDNYGKLKTGKDLEIAQILREHRDAKSKFFKYEEKEGAFQTSYNQFAQVEKLRMINEGLTEGSAEFDQEFKLRKDSWLKYNTKLKISPKFYEKRNLIMSNIKALMKDDSKYDTNIDAILDSLQGRRDQNGQPIGTEMTEEHLKMIRDVEQDNWNAKQALENISGLTQEESIELQNYYDALNDNQKLSPAEYKRYKALIKKKHDKGVNNSTKETLISLFNALDELQEKQATDYYLEIINNHYRAIKIADGVENPKVIDHSNVHLFSNPDAVDPILAQSEEFSKWFWNNHIKKVKYNKKTNKVELMYERTYAWSVTRPKSDEYLEKTEIKNELGQVVETISGIPAFKYFERSVKDEYLTGYNSETGKVELEVGKHISVPGLVTPDLPKGLEDMEKTLKKYPKQMEEQALKGHDYDRYINRKYLALKNEGGARYKALEYIKNFHLEHQKDLERHARLGLELPRYRRDMYEYIAEKGVKKSGGDAWKRLVGGFTQLWVAKKDDYEDGLNFDDEMLLVNSDLAANQSSRVPITGKFFIESDQVSKDITSSVMMYFQSSLQNKKLREIQPVAEAFRRLALEQNPVDVKRLNKLSMEQRVGRPAPRTKNNNRGKVIDSMVETFFEGKKLFSGQNNAVAVKSINNMLGLASHSFFAFDITSAAKNFLGAQFQIALEGAGNKYFNYRDWHRGRPWANKTMWEISGQIYKNTPKTLNVQLIDLFDAIQGRFEEKFGESLSRSFARDAANMSWTTTHRKWLETEATIQLFSAIMHSTKVKQTINGETKEIRYIDAWEIDSDTKQVKLKPGIDSSWDIKGENFNKVKFKNHEVSNFLQGAYAAMDQPMVSRYMLWRLVASMRKYFTKMFLHRYAGTRITNSKKHAWYDPQARFNLATGQMHMGFYARNWQTMRNMFRDPKTGKMTFLPNNVFSKFMTMTKDEVRALKMGALELLKINLLTMSYLFLWGFDPEDEDKWKKRKGEMDTGAFFKGSGALPWLGLTDEEWTENFNMQGWVGNQLLLLAMHVEAENEHFIPFPGYGMKDLINVFSESSVASGPSIVGIARLFEDLWDTMAGDEGQYYQKDVGALNIQQAGENKFWKHAASMMGLKGKFIDPTTSLKNFKNAREKD